MDLNIKTIFNKLAYVNKEISINMPESLSISSIKPFNEKLQKYRADIIYIMDGSYCLSSLPITNCNNLICIVKSDETVSKIEYTPEANIIYIYDQLETDILIEEIEEVINESIQFLKDSEALFFMLYKGKGLQKILDKAYGLLGNLVVLSDTSMRVVYSSSNKIDENLTNWLYDEGIHNYNNFYIKHKKERGFEKSYNSKEPTYISKEIDEYAHLASNIFINEQLVGYLTVIESEKKIEKADYKIISVLCDVISLELQKDKLVLNERGYYYERLFIELLDEKISDPLILDDKIKRLDLNLASDLFVFTFVVNQDELANTNFPYIRNIIEDFIDNFNTIIYKDQIIGVISIDTDKSIYDMFDIKKLKLFLKNNKMNCGISHSFHHIKDLPIFYKQSLNAIETGIHLYNSETIFNYETFAHYHMIRICSHSYVLNSFCHPSLIKLQEYDRNTSSELVHSLYTYLLQEKNQHLSADILHIHRSTLLYRIKKAEEIMHLSLKNGKIVFNLLNSFKILEYLGEIDSHDYNSSLLSEINL